MGRSETNNMLRSAVSGFVILILLLQGSVLVFMALGKPMATWYWPIVDYPMYSEVHQEGEYLKDSLSLEVVTKDGEVSKVTAKDVGLNFWKFFYICSGISRSSQKSADLLISILPDGNNVTELRIYSSPFIITKNGKAVAPVKLLNTMSVSLGS